MYGTCQASMETGLLSVTMVTPVLYSVIGAVITHFIVPQAWCVCGHLVLCGGGGVRVCRVTGVERVSLATVLGRRTTPPQEALLVTPSWADPAQVGAGVRSVI